MSYTPDKIKATGADTARLIADHFADTYYAADWGVKSDGVQLYDINISNNSAVLSSASYSFTAADQGKSIVVSSYDSAQALTTTISSVASGNATLATNWTGTSISNRTGRATFYTTDNTTTLAKALSDIVARHADANGRNKVGFRLVIPSGVCVTGPFTIPRLCIVQGQGGIPGTCLFLKSGSNADFITSENFATLTGTGLNYGNGVATNTSLSVPSWFGLEDIRIDANRAGNTSGNGVSFYGNASIFRRVYIEEAKSIGVYSEASGDFAWSAHDWLGTEEGIVDELVVRSCGNGILWRGPHDTTMNLVRAFLNQGYNFKNELASTTTANGAAIYNGGVHIVYMHTYTSDGGSGQIINAPTSFGESETDYDNMQVGVSNFKISKLYQNAAGRLGNDALNVANLVGFTQIGEHNLTFLDATSGGLASKGVNLVSGSGPTVIGSTAGTSIQPAAGTTGYYIRGNFTRMPNIAAGNYSSTGSVATDLGGNYQFVCQSGFLNKTHLLYTTGLYNVIMLQAFTNAGADGTAFSGTIGKQDFAVILSDDPNLLPLVSVPRLLIGGKDAMRYPSSDNTYGESIAIGVGTLSGQTTGGVDYNNIAIGYQAMTGTMTTAAIDNVAIGYQALKALTTGNLNTAIGFVAGTTLTTAAKNTLLGFAAGQYLNSDSNTFIGYKTGQGITATPLTGTGNTAVGNAAGILLQGAAASNALFGLSAGNKLTTGGSNVVIGPAVASMTLSTGSSNILIGTSSAVDTASASTSSYLSINGLITGNMTSGSEQISLNGSVVNKTRTVTASGAVTVSVNDYAIFINKTSGAATIVNLPASPATGMTLIIKDLKGDAATNNITLTPASGTIDGGSTYVMNTNRQAATIMYNGTEWSVL
jgi:hypothetical protein